MSATQFNERDCLAWSRFMLANLALISASLDAGDGASPLIEVVRARLRRAWDGLGAQGVEGAMLSMILSLEAMGCQIKSTQTSPENSEIIVEQFPGTAMLDGLSDRFDIEIDKQSWRSLMGADDEAARRIYDLLGAIADGAGVEYAREQTEEGDVRLILRAW